MISPYLVSLINHITPNPCLVGFSRLKLIPTIGAAPAEKDPKEDCNSSGKLGDLTPEEIQKIQSVVNKVQRPLEVIGSAARCERKAGSDIDYITNQQYLPDFIKVQKELPDLDPAHGIVPGASNPFQGPAVRFEPSASPRFIPMKE